jgi:transcriptional regulator with XRE-family HTH domain
MLVIGKMRNPYEMEKGAMMPAATDGKGKGKRRSESVGPAVGAYLRTMRDAHGWSLEEAGHRIGLHRNTLWELENNKRGVQGDTIQAIMQMYGGKMEDIDRLQGKTGDEGKAVAERRILLNKAGGEDQVVGKFAAIMGANGAGLLAATVSSETRLEILRLIDKHPELEKTILTLLRSFEADPPAPQS